VFPFSSGNTMIDYLPLRLGNYPQDRGTRPGEEQGSFIDGCPREWGQLPAPNGPLTVGIDGGFVRAPRKDGWFEVIAGKSMLSFTRDEAQAEPASKCFGFVRTFDTKPKRRLFELLKLQGMQMNQQLVFLSDGGDSMRDLQEYLNPEAEHWLDWFHITMRLTVLGQYAKGVKEKNAALAVRRRKHWNASNITCGMATSFRLCKSLKTWKAM